MTVTLIVYPCRKYLERNGYQEALSAIWGEGKNVYRSCRLLLFSQYHFRPFRCLTLFI